MPKKPHQHSTPDDELAVCRLYAEGSTYDQIRLATNCSPETTRRILHRRGMLLDRGGKQLSATEIVDAIDRYQSGQYGRQIAAALGCNHQTILKHVRESGIKTRTSAEVKRRHHFREDAFDDPLNCEAAAYWLGMLLADGTVSGRTGHVVLSLSGEDGAHVGAFREFMETTAPLSVVLCRPRPYNAAPRTSLTICSHSLTRRLARWGIVPRKSLTATPPPELCDSASFWRGVVDGDGSVSLVPKTVSHTAALSLCGSLPTVEAFIAFAKKRTDTRVRAVAHASIWKATLRGRHAFRMLRVLYDGCTVALPRKQRAAAHILAACEENGHVYHEGKNRRRYAQITHGPRIAGPSLLQSQRQQSGRPE